MRVQVDGSNVTVLDDQGRPAGGPGEVVTVEVAANRVSFETGPDERFYGTGARADAVQRRGLETENYVSDGPYTEKDRPLVEAFVPPQGFRPRDDSTYFPVPWVLSSRGYGVLVRNDETSWFRFGSPWEIEVEAPTLVLEVYAGPTMAEALRRFTEHAGRQPEPPSWVWGPWFQTGQADQVALDLEREYTRKLRDADAPVSVAETHMRYLPAGAHQGLRDGERARTEFFHSYGLATLTYFNPLLCTEYEEVFAEASKRGALQKTATGEPAVYNGYVGGAVPSIREYGQFDFTTDAAREIYRRLLDEAMADGHDGWMEDFGEYTPLDAVDSTGRTGTALHNSYPTQFHGAVAGLTDRLRFVRSGWTGTAAYVPIVWGGDPTSVWDFDGLSSAVRLGLSAGLSGIGVWGSDIGGFFALGDDALTPELLYRWIQFGAVSGIMRTKGEGIAIPPKDRPLIWDEPHIRIWRRYAKLRTQLAPYIAETAAEYRRTGMPMMRHLSLRYADQPEVAAQDDVYMFGPDLLAAPVLTEGATTRTLRLPAGDWIDLWRSVTYRESDGALDLGAVTLLAGGKEVTLPAPIDELPLLVRAGALLPLLPADVDTLADVGDAPGLVKARDRDDRLDILAFPNGESSARFGDGETLRSRTDGSGWTLRIDGSRERTYQVQAAVRATEVRLDGEPLESWSCDGSVLRATFTTVFGTFETLDAWS